MLTAIIAAWLVNGATKPVLAEPCYDWWAATGINGAQTAGEKALQADVRDLKPGQTIEREIGEGESHSYRISLKAGQYVNVLVEERCIEVGVQVLDPAGKVIAEISWDDKGSVESFWALAEATGDYQLRIASAEVRGSDSGYTIKLAKVAALQTAPVSDQNYVKAYRLFWEAGELRDQDSDQSVSQAKDKYEEAILLWRELGDNIKEAYTLYDLGYVYRRLGEQQKALELYNQALPIWRAAENRQREEADTLRDIALIKMPQGKLPEALDALSKELALRRFLGDGKKQALALSNMGQAYYSQGDFQTAMERYKEALPLGRASGDRRTVAIILSNISGVYFNLGEFQQALDYCNQALLLRRVAGDRRGEAITLSNIGSNYRELGEPQKALDYSQWALSLLREVGDWYSESAILDVIGRDYYDLGDYPKALESHKQSLSLRQMMKDRYGEGSALANIGNAYARMGERQKALEYLEQSLQLRRALGDRRGEALTLQSAGELYRELGEAQKALAYFSQGLTLSQAIKNRVYEANLLYDIARIEQSSGLFLEAQARIEAAIATIESTRSNVARADLQSSFLASKQDFYEFEIDLLMQSYRRDQDQESLVKAFSVSERRRARSLLDSLEETRANIRQGVSPGLLTRERAIRATLDQKAESQIKLLSGKHTPEQAAALAKEVATITDDYEQLLADIRASSPRYAALTQSAPLSFEELQTEILDPDALLLEYSLGKERSYLWAVTSTDITGYELPSRSEIEGQARNIYDLLTSRNRFVKFEKPDERQARVAKADTEYCLAAGRLSQLLLGPLGAKMRGKRLLIVTDGALQYLPFAALPSPQVNTAKENEQETRRGYRPLMVDHEVTSLPSASVLGVLRREVRGRKPAPKTVAVLADPVFSETDERVTELKSARKSGDQLTKSGEAVRAEDGLESELVRSVRDLSAENGLEIARLPFTRQEAKAILALIPRAEQFAALDFDANRAAATSPELSMYRIVHFATHGLLNPTHPGLSGLILSIVDRQGNDQDGFLPTHEIFNLNLPVDLVVLSGCRTGLGKEIKGEGMLGLTRGFMYAGAARVAVSLWDVNDKSTADLMAQFYSGMLGKRRLSPAAALRGAQVAMWKSIRWRSPYYWAAFVLQGEYR